MGLFDKFRKKEDGSDDIVAMADGDLFDVTTVPDQVFSQKMLGDSVAFQYAGDSVDVCAPASGTLTVLYPTGHAFGITRADGVELLVHIGIDTVEANGDGFTLGKFRQGDQVKAGDLIVTADLKKLGAKYNMSTMLIITNANGKEIHFIAPQHVTKGQSVIQK